MRAPKNLDDYTDAETAAKGLEDYARDLRANAAPGDRVKWSLNVCCWNDEWLKQQAPGRVVVAGQAITSK